MANDDQYVPSEALLRTAWSDYCQSMDDCNAWVRPDGIDTRAEFDRFLARVRRDAAREALDGLSTWLGELAEKHPARSTHVPLMQGHITRYTTDHHPEEAP